MLVGSVYDDVRSVHRQVYGSINKTKQDTESKERSPSKRSRTP